MNKTKFCHNFMPLQENTNQQKHTIDKIMKKMKENSPFKDL